MTFNIDDLKKKIIYRSNYRGTKELDKLLSTFTRSIINQLKCEIKKGIINYYLHLIN